MPTSYVIQGEMCTGRDFCHGGFADVRKGEYSGSTLAIKHLRVNRGDYSNVFKRFFRDVIEWKRPEHPGILRLLGIPLAADKNRLKILTEWMPNGNLMEFAKPNPQANRLRLISEVMSGMAYLHQLGVVYGDLKGSNILVDPVDSTATARVADFGLMTIADTSTNLLSESSLSSAGTFRWVGPELLYPKRFGPDSGQTCESDSYALGMVIYEVLSSHLPFYHMRACSAVTGAAIDSEHPGKPPSAEPLGFSDALWELVRQCWSELGQTPSKPTSSRLPRPSPIL